MDYTSNNIKPPVDQAFGEIESETVLSTLASLFLCLAKDRLDNDGVANDGLTTHQEIGYLANAFATDPATY